ncbi:hypothetical protein B0H13DRAFT_2274937 [Mycena leptocephala]|nr:hypothetical protein B0H13DRAFT_2274937 [Mycena leptocephala]
MHCPGPTLTALALAHAMTTKPAPAAACIYVHHCRLRSRRIKAQALRNQDEDLRAPYTRPQPPMHYDISYRESFSARSVACSYHLHTPCQRASAIPLRESGASISFGRPEADRSRLHPLVPAQKIYRWQAGDEPPDERHPTFPSGRMFPAPRSPARFFLLLMHTHHKTRIDHVLQCMTVIYPGAAGRARGGTYTSENDNHETSCALNCTTISTSTFGGLYVGSLITMIRISSGARSLGASVQKKALGNREQGAAEYALQPRGRSCVLERSAGVSDTSEPPFVAYPSDRIMKIKSNGNGAPSINFTVSNIFSAAALGAQQPESDSVLNSTRSRSTKIF